MNQLSEIVGIMSLPGDRPDFLIAVLIAVALGDNYISSLFGDSELVSLLSKYGFVKT